MSHYHLNINERCCIYNFIKEGFSIRSISKALNRSPSTISRELKRNSHSISKIYYPEAAERKYLKRRTICNRKKIRDDKIIEYIRDKLCLRWSPEQISHRKNEFNGIKIPSTVTIYRMIHDKRVPTIKMEHLRRKGHFKRPAESRGKFNVDSKHLIKKDLEIYIKDWN